MNTLLITVLSDIRYGMFVAIRAGSTSLIQPAKSIISDFS